MLYELLPRSCRLPLPSAVFGSSARSCYHCLKTKVLLFLQSFQVLRNLVIVTLGRFVHATDFSFRLIFTEFLGVGRYLESEEALLGLYKQPVAGIYMNSRENLRAEVRANQITRRWENKKEEDEEDEAQTLSFIHNLVTVGLIIQRWIGFIGSYMYLQIAT
ncbi:hypothetical protein AXF42_Ash011976 [Apostasia shenzhenica]|uniref:Uncharacterized protein n=1 Tax=Apostasia shenzhenica TaxID=1088818 RepID=A0A2I0AJE3_9ASPA|nr:hypothetical protein AXF42_Ash011976 [Apostasia shenzhenica]